MRNINDAEVKKTATDFATWFKMQGAYTTAVEDYYDRWVKIKNDAGRKICKDKGHDWEPLDFAYNGSSYVCKRCGIED